MNAKVINISRGPTITRYELAPESGVRVRAISALVDDISLNLAASGVRIEAPIPGKAAVGIEVPNRVVATVYLRELVSNEKFTSATSKLTASLGEDVAGEPIYLDHCKNASSFDCRSYRSGKISMYQQYDCEFALQSKAGRSQVYTNRP